MKKLLKWLGGLLLLMFLLIIGLVGYATATESGLHQLLSLGQRFAPGKLSWQQAGGQLSGPLDLEGLRYRQEDGLSLQVENTALRWQPSALFSRKLAIQRLSLSGVEIHLPKGEKKKESAPAKPLVLPDIHLPVAVSIDELNLEDIRIYPWGAAEPIIVEKLTLAALGEGDSLQLVNLDISAPEGEAHLSGIIEPVGSYPLDLQLQWRFGHAEFGEFKGSGTAAGDLETLHLQQAVTGAIDVDLTADVAEVVDNPGWDAALKLSSANLGVFSPALQASPLRATVSSSGNLQRFSASGQIATGVEQTGPVALDFSAQGNTHAIEIENAVLKLVDQPGEIALTGNVELQPMKMVLRGSWRELGWPIKAAERDYRLPKGTLTFTGDPRDFTAAVQTNLEGAQLGKLHLKLDVRGKEDLLRLSALDLTSPDSQLHLQASGAFNLKQRTVAAKGRWTSIRWPLVGAEAPLVESPKGAFTAGGKLDDYRFEMTAEARGKDIPEGEWKLTGKGTDQALSGFKVSGKLLDGMLNAGGKAAWKPAVTWDISLDGQGLNPGVKWPDVPGKINLRLVSKGGLVGGKPALTAKLDSLRGALRGQQLRGSGEVALKNDTLKVRGLKLTSGSASFTANGELGDRWDLDWRLRAPELASLAPQLKGQIRGNGSLRGAADNPKLALDLDIQNLVAGDTRISRLAGKASIDISGSRRSTMDFSGKSLQLAGQKWSDLALKGSGTPNRHNLKLSLNGGLARLKLALSGGLKNRQWIGRVTELSALKTSVGNWRLSQPTRLVVDERSASADRLCVTSKPSRICVKGQWDKSAGAAGKVEISELDATRFRKFLPADIRLKTALDGTVTGKLGSSGDINGVAEFTLKEGQLTVPGDTDPVVIGFGTSQLKSVYRDNSLDSVLTLDLGKLGGVDGDIKLKALDAKPGLSGRLRADIRDLSIVSAFAPQLQAVQGKLHADFRLAGPATLPKVNGVLTVDNFAAEVPQMSIRIEDTRISARSNGHGPLKIAGQAKSGRGQLKLSGDIDTATRKLQLAIKGANFQVANTRNIRAEISPDMKVQMDSKGMRVAGELVVPSAFIKAEGGGEEGLVTVSSDVVIVKEGEPEKKSKTGNFFLNLRVVLGDDIKVEVADFKGALKGNLMIEQEPELAPRGTGAIEVVNGDYVVYGQELKIQRGRILFSGGPIDNPRLDMDVARRVEAYDVLAGARIRGTAQAPLLQLYSEPSMPDASILSYMLLGQPPGTKGGSYTLGKYLTPDLYVGYGIGLFNAINTFNMRYKLTDKLALQAASGVASSADLIYTIER